MFTKAGETNRYDNDNWRQRLVPHGSRQTRLGFPERTSLDPLAGMKGFGCITSRDANRLGATIRLSIAGMRAPFAPCPVNFPIDFTEGTVRPRTLLFHGLNPVPLGRCATY